MKQFIDECQYILTGKFFVTVIIVPLVIAVVFGYVYQNNAIQEGALAIVDLDHTEKSAELIRKLDASQYVQVKDVFYEDVDPNELLYTEQYLAVFYLPNGLEENSIQGLQTTVGFYIDMALATATGNLRSGVAEVFSTENAAITFGTLKAVGLTDERVAGTVASFALSQRLLYNPLGNTLSSMVLGFMNIVLLALVTSATISIVPRLREEGKLQQALVSPIGFYSRLVPYMVAGFVSMYLFLGLLKQVGGMRFEVNVTQFWIPALMYTFSISLFAMILGWSAQTKQKASSRLMIAVLPTSLLGGILMPVQMLPQVLQYVGYTLPLNWFFKFVRGMGLRGGDISFFTNLLKNFGLYVLILFAITMLLLVAELVKAKRTEQQSIDKLAPPLSQDDLRE